MGRAPCCDKANVKKGPWSPEEDARLKEYIESHGTGGNWIAFPQKAGLKRCGKSCRLRWLNYLRPNIKHGEFSEDEDRIICTLFASIGSRWSIIAAQLPGRTDNDIKNYWNTKLKKKLLGVVQFQHSHRKPHQILQSPSPSSPSTSTFLYNNCSSSNNIYHTPSTSFTSFETSYNNSPSFSAAASIVQPQESLLGPIHHNYQRFGGDQASCSSSYGSCSNQFNHNRDLDYEYGGNNDEQLGSLQSYSNFYHEANESQKQQLILGSNGSCVNGLWGETETLELEYELEEIKQQISTSSCNSFIF